jgi:hypothetical protein
LISSLVLKNYLYFVYGLIINQFVAIIWSLKNYKYKKFRFSMDISKGHKNMEQLIMVSGALSYIMFNK